MRPLVMKQYELNLSIDNAFNRNRFTLRYSTLVNNSLVLIILILILSISIQGCNSQESGIPTPKGLLCELLREPGKAVITDSVPEFSWIFPVEGQYQSAYRILVASSLELLEEDQADLWDSNKVSSSKSVNVLYKGKPFKEKASYFWKVKVWGGETSVSSYSKAQQFNTGVFENRQDEWVGQSHYVQLTKDYWVSENRQTATFHDKPHIQLQLNEAGDYFADFGKAAFAILVFTVESDSEQEIEIYLGERKNKDSNTVNKTPGESQIGFEKVVFKLRKGFHEYQLEIPEHHSKSPHTQKLAPFYPEVLPFRYVEIKGDTKLFKIKNISQKALYYPFDDQASSYKTDNENLNKVLELCKYTLKATPFLGLYADGNRERMPYEADAYIQQLGHYSVDREFSIARYTNDFLIYHASWPTEWQFHTLFMAWEDHMHTGNTEFIKTHYESLKAKTLMALKRDDGLISTKTNKVSEKFRSSIHYEGNKFRDIIDWPKGTPKGEKQARNAGPAPEGEQDGYEFVEYNTVVNAFYYHALLLMAEMANAIGENDDYTLFKVSATQVKKVFRKTFFDVERGVFLDGEGATHASLHANMFPLAFGLVDKKDITTVVDLIKNKGMVCSVYGAQYLLDGLYDVGQSEYALSLMTSENKRSWMNMINVGSTMTTEAWDEYYKPNLTWNHAWGSAPINIMARKVLGIKPTSPGFETFIIKPQPEGLKRIEAKTPTIRGPIACDFYDKGNSWQLKISVPGNSKAKLILPNRFSSIYVNGKQVSFTTYKDSYGKSYKSVTLVPGTATIVCD